MDRSNATGPRGSLNEPPRIKAALVDFCLHVDEHTEIRLLRVEDADALYDAVMRNRDHLKPWMTWVDKVIDASDTYAFVRGSEREAYEHTSFKAGIWRNRELIGLIDLKDIDWANGHAAIGYWLDQEFSGHGLMTQAVRLLTEYAFEALDLHRVEIHVATENTRSRGVPERLGFALEGVMRGVQRIRGTYLDHALYALVREDDRM